MKTALALSALALLGWHSASHAATQIDLAQGQALYESHCMKCHAISTNHVGPRHQNVVGRRAGSVADFMYSAALKNSNVVWTEEMLDRWLRNPEALIPGQEMDVRVKSAEERRLLIQYLKSQSLAPNPSQTAPP
ncbi:c-type cytochrome [Aquabacterium sp.]|uniref:c-type cytochrome n=1 Tax=Aquabacterium sp. TaxID=1872578 RepID=UPI003D6D93F7